MIRTPIIMLISITSVTLSGCVGYTTYPPADWQTASGDISGPPADELMVESLRHVIDRFPPGGVGTVALNLPEGVHDRAYAVIAGRVNSAVEPDVEPMSPGLESMPTYHVTRLWVRGSRAEVDVMRPVGELGPSPSGEPIIQAVTVHLEGGLSQWRVVRTRPWVIGADAVPEAHFYGVEETPEPEG